MPRGTYIFFVFLFISLSVNMLVLLVVRLYVHHICEMYDNSLAIIFQKA